MVSQILAVIIFVVMFVEIVREKFPRYLVTLVAGVLKYRNIIQFNSLTVQRFRNTYKDEMDLNKYNKYVDSHF